jgi:hypothetical protein
VRTKVESVGRRAERGSASRGEEFLEAFRLRRRASSQVCSGAPGAGGPNPTFASCPTGTVVIGGGAVSLGTGATMVGSHPNTDTSWEVDVPNNGGGSVEVFTTAICAATG